MTRVIKFIIVFLGSTMLHSLVQFLGVANFVYAIYFNTYVVKMPDDSPRYQARLTFTIGILDSQFGRVWGQLSAQ